MSEVEVLGQTVDVDSPDIGYTHTLKISMGKALNIYECPYCGQSFVIQHRWEDEYKKLARRWVFGWFLNNDCDVTGDEGDPSVVEDYSAASPDTSQQKLFSGTFESPDTSKVPQSA